MVYSVLCAVIAILTVSMPSSHALWPMPKSLSTGSTPLKLTASQFKITTEFAETHGHSTNTPADLTQAIQRTTAHLQNDKMERLVVGGGAADKSAISSKQVKTINELSMSLVKGAVVRSIAEEAVLPLEQRNEAYELQVPADGSSATLTANTTLGLLRGLTTFEQLWYFVDGEVYTLEAPVEIADRPSYVYRGFMLDTARNFFPVSDIKRTLDAMSMAKLNTFHWHATDSQSFPLQVPGFTEVSAKGAYSASMVFTPDDVQDIVTYAGERGIDVLVEIDTPGHTMIIHESHPEHVACAQASPWSNFANEPPAGQLRLASPATANFTASLLHAAAHLFPSPFFSTGGDELNANCYDQDAETQQILNSTGQTLEQALSGFVGATHTALRSVGKTPVVWEEMVLDHDIELENDTVVMVWISSQNAAAVAEKNFRLVHGPSDYFYLDCGAGEWLGVDPTGNSWCDPFKTWSKSYTFDPMANISDANAHLVLGGEQLLWTEQSSPSNLDSIVWPRAASSAEIFWTGATLPDGSPRNVGTALPRLHDLRYRMVQRGIQAIALQPHFCAIRPEECDVNA
ncbi:N-acetyl-glucosamine-6-phosphate deacetylase [Steccherinum ochraceum]|uniref:Beta-hexosaminidase n=1 Tax=Steccherinum ochraceum TaxID=92696 RepID=A0A4R0RIY9_9APHY|nr:N-acetyl-glucosamine-6-phosphate deacetylase [Steccherinum ochraceum]